MSKYVFVAVLSLILFGTLFSFAEESQDMHGSSTSPKGKYVKANGLNIYYEEYGSGEPLILIHGGLNSSALWENNLSSFLDHFRVIVPDSRGHGRTNNPRDTLSYRLMADDVASLVSALNLDRPFVCGYSDGGQIALELGMHHSDKFRALVVAAAWFKFSSVYTDGIKNLGMSGPDEADYNMFEKQYPSLVEVIQTSGVEDWKTFFRHTTEMFWTPLNYTADDFAGIVIPTLVLIGDRDEYIPVEEAVEMYNMIPNAELAVVPQTTHGNLLANSDLFADLVLNFLLRHSAKPIELKAKEH